MKHSNLGKLGVTDLLATAFPLLVAVLLLGLFIIPNYNRAVESTREANTLRAVADECATRNKDLRVLTQDVERLRRELAQRGRKLPAAPDQGVLLACLARAADTKGIQSHMAKSGKLMPVSVPGLPGGKAMRRTVDVQMVGSFDSLFNAVSDAERLPAVVTVRAIDMACNPKGQADVPEIEATFTFDEFFSERAQDGRTDGAESAPRKAGR